MGPRRAGYGLVPDVAFVSRGRRREAVIEVTCFGGEFAQLADGDSVQGKGLRVERKCYRQKAILGVEPPLGFRRAEDPAFWERRTPRVRPPAFYRPCGRTFG